MTDFDLRETTKREALETLVERCLTNVDVLCRCMDALTPDNFAFDYDLRIAFFSLIGKFIKGTYDPETNRDALVLGLACLDKGLELDPNGATLADHFYFWDRTIDDWYTPWTAVDAYVDALLAAVVSMNEIEADTAAVLRDNFANAPLAVDPLVEDAVWDRIRNATLGRRALRFSKAVPALPPPPVNAAATWGRIVSRVYQ